MEKWNKSDTEKLKAISSLGKILVILSDTQDWLGNSMRKAQLVDVVAAYKNVPHYLERLRTLNYHLFLPRSSWYGSWKNHISEYDTVILFDVFLASDMAEYIEQRSPKTRLIVYYYNPWYNNYYLSDAAKKKCEIWSFDRQDCKKYGLKYNHQFYFNQHINGEKDPRYASDVYFIGKDKGRLAFLQSLKRYFTDEKINAKLVIIPDRKIYTKEEKELLSAQTLPYEDNLQYVANTDCLLEVVQEYQEGITRRMMEAMFFGKKIITTNKSTKNYDFFDPKNIYIWGSDKRNVCDFVCDRTPAEWKSEVLKYYSFENWLYNFTENIKT